MEPAHRPLTRTDVVTAQIAAGNLSEYLAAAQARFVWQIARTPDFTTPQNITLTNFDLPARIGLRHG